MELGGGAVVAACRHKTWFEGAAAVSLETRQLLQRGAGVGLREYARGHAVLHGSGVAFSGRGISIIGRPGIGKSTLAAWLCRSGWSFASDAMTVVDTRTRELVALEPRFRLHEDSLSVLGKTAHNAPLDDQVTQKRRLMVADASWVTPGTKLSHVFHLVSAQKFSISHLGRAESMMTLVSNAYLASRFGEGMSARLLSLSLALVSAGVRVYRVEFRKEWHLLDQLRDGLERLLNDDSIP